MANAVTHGAGFFLSLIALYYLVDRALASEDFFRLIGCTVFGVTLVTLYASSTLLHSAEAARRETRYELFDHCAIYLLIAGSYTPLFLVPMHGLLGWTMLAVIWALAAGGIIFKMICGCNTHVRWSLTSYLLEGWLPLLILPQMIAALNAGSIFWLVAGGVMYTVGVPFYLSQRLRYSHAIWHLFVLAGSVCHFFAVIRALFPPA